MTPQLPTAHILYENPAWLPPLIEALEDEGFPTRLVSVDGGMIDPSEIPDEGIWINRISPSSHTRGHDHSVALTRDVLAWLEAHGRRVINGLGAFEIEMSKLRQDIALRKQGILTPRTLLAVGRARILEAAGRLHGPFITKHNQGGKGLGIHLFNHVDELDEHLDGPNFDPGPDGKIILQQYIRPAHDRITRVEIVGGRLLFAMHSSTAEGFELCPSDACQTPAAAPQVCPAGGDTGLFSPADIDADDPLVRQYIRLCADEGIDVAGIEFVTDAEGRRYTYDINGTTNYSGTLAARTGVHGMRALARHLVEVTDVAALARVA